ncbi:hypothetical protein V1224_15725 [Lachnospiraceae bacterium JLR.KK008]
MVKWQGTIDWQQSNDYDRIQPIAVERIKKKRRTMNGRSREE